MRVYFVEHFEDDCNTRTIYNITCI